VPHSVGAWRYSPTDPYLSFCNVTYQPNLVLHSAEIKNLLLFVLKSSGLQHYVAVTHVHINAQKEYWELNIDKGGITSNHPLGTGNTIHPQCRLGSLRALAFSYVVKPSRLRLYPCRAIGHTAMPIQVS
jgi:hypothetical protein